MPGTAGDLGDCLEEEHARLDGACSRFARADSTCSSVDHAAAFPNGHMYPFHHFGSQVRCRVCRLANRMDGLAHDCDAFDLDFVGSCP